MKLAAKLILVFLCGVLCIVAVSAWQAVIRLQAWEQERHELQATQLVDAISPAIADAYAEGGTLTIEQAFEISSRSVSRTTDMQMVDNQDARQVPDMTSIQHRVSSISITRSDGTRASRTFVPLVIDGKDAGVIQVSHPLEEHDAFIRRSIAGTAIALIGVTVFSGIVIYLGGVRLIAHPLNKLLLQIKSIGEGDLDQEPVLKSKDELGRLAVAISDMSGQLRKQQETIRHTDRLSTVGTLAAGIAHEMGTPLNVVSGQAALMSSGRLSTPEMIESATAIKEEADRMTSIIRQLLDFARHKTTPHTTLSVADVVERTSNLMKPLARKTNTTIAVEQGNEDAFVSGDSSQLQQVFTNLISNSISAMPEGGTIRVVINRDQSSNHVFIDVTDSGPGISHDVLEHIFEPFFTTKDVGQGTGLGHSIAYGIVREHGGEITVENTNANGTTFRVSLPMETVEGESNDD